MADNCLLTVWPYLALHRSEQQIVLKAGIFQTQLMQNMKSNELIKHSICVHM